MKAKPIAIAAGAGLAATLVYQAMPSHGGLSKYPNGIPGGVITVAAIVGVAIVAAVILTR